MSLTIRHKYKYFHSAVQRARDRWQKFHFCRLPFDVRPRNVKLNLSKIFISTLTSSKASWASNSCLKRFARCRFTELQGRVFILQKMLEKDLTVAKINLQVV